MLMLKEILLHSAKLAAMAVLLGLVGCGGGGGGGDDSGLGAGVNDDVLCGSDPCPDNSDDTDDDTDTSTDGTNVIGSGSGSSFQPGVLAVGIGSNSLAAGGTTTVSVNIANDQTGVLLTEATEFSFTSGCVSQGTAFFDSSTVTSSSGGVTVSYTAAGCVGSDTITATANGLTATTTIQVEAANVLSIKFISATPENIQLAGTGGDVTSVVTFQVLGDLGDPVTEQSVTFSLDTNAGGVNLANDTDISDINGNVSTIVQAGTAPTPVRVTAVHDATGIATQSSVLAVSTGITDGDSFSVGLSVFNPDAWSFLNSNAITVTAALGDVFNNPPPEGTAVLFETNGGRIQGSCTTDEDGNCTVNWSSQSPYPMFSDFNGNPQLGDAYIIAHTSGAESFDDNNGNGSYDDGETFEDLGEPFFDEDQDGVYDAGVERFVDANNNGSYDAPDGFFNGPLCSHSTDCPSGTRKVTTIWKSSYFVMSSIDESVELLDGATVVNVLDTIDIGFGKTLVATIGDENDNSLPNGSNITISTDNGEVTSSTSISIPSNVTQPRTFSIRIIPDDDPSNDGNLKITVDTPRGLAVEYEYAINEIISVTMPAALAGQVDLDASGAGSDTMVVQFRDAANNALPASFSWTAVPATSDDACFTFTPQSGDFSGLIGDDVTFTLTDVAACNATTSVAITVFNNAGQAIFQDITALQY